MKKIDILNFITNFRQAPNDIKTHAAILEKMGMVNEPAINQMLEELKQAKVVREVDQAGQRAFQVIAR